MKHITIDYGIDLGTTNSAICRMENGEPVVVRSDVGAETMPSCIMFKKGGVIRTGETAYNDLGRDKLRALKKKTPTASSAFQEFKRYMGSERTYANAYTEQDWTPEDLSAQVVKALCSFVNDDEITAAVITVPAKFTVNQKDATLQAGRRAGIRQIELLQEPIAASLAYGLRAEEKNGTWMVFDFGGGTLDVALVHVCDGVMQVFDTEGDNYLGGKNIDEAIVSKIIMPKLTELYAIDFSDRCQYDLLLDALKVEAEKLKKKLSYCEQETLYLEAGDWGEDADGEEIELELTVTRHQVEEAIGPILQKAVDVCKTLMMRNNLSFLQLSHLIPIGGPTLMPRLRQMLRQQVTPNVETSINPMTAVAMGAAIYASTIPVKADKKNVDEDILPLSLIYDTTSVDTTTYIVVRGVETIEHLTVKAIRRADGWESPQVDVGGKGGIIEACLLPNQPNIFRLSAMIGSKVVPCHPSEITIIQGKKIGSAILPYNIGIEVFNPKTNKSVFTAMTGLEKNKTLPANGYAYGLKTLSDLRPGHEEDVIRVAIFQGDEDAEGKTASLFEYVSDVVVTGDDIASYVPKGSLINIRIAVDRSEMMTVGVEFTLSRQTVEKELDTSKRQRSKDEQYLQRQIEYCHSEIRRLSSHVDVEDTQLLKGKIDQIESDLHSGAQHKQVEQHLKEVLRQIENFESLSEWTKQQTKLRKMLIQLQGELLKQGSESAKLVIESYKARVDRVSSLKDAEQAKELEREMYNYWYSLYEDEDNRSYILDCNRYFDTLEWTDKFSARRLVKEGIALIEKNPNATRNETAVIVNALWSNQKHLNSTVQECGDKPKHRTDIPSI